MYDCYGVWVNVLINWIVKICCFVGYLVGCDNKNGEIGKGLIDMCYLFVVVLILVGGILVIVIMFVEVVCKMLYWVLLSVSEVMMCKGLG